MTLLLVPERSSLAASVSVLAAQLFPQKNSSVVRAVDMLRQGQEPLSSLTRYLMTSRGEQLAGSIHYWPITVGPHEALLLGPVMVDKEFSGKSYPELLGRKPGVVLIEETLKIAKRKGHKLVVLKAACPELMPYYESFGFTKLQGVSLPTHNAQEEALLMGLSLDPHINISSLSGPVTGGWASAQNAQPKEETAKPAFVFRQVLGQAAKPFVPLTAAGLRLRCA